ncbi:RNA polymerase sigma factor SigI [Falsibacillus pallidus]|uniref:RNA polymerase sigma factor SigI n=1 Tax=Falsibacillus pallidus TaxID=493781 RepID=UPI003D972C83
MLGLLFMARKKKKSLEELAVEIQNGNDDAVTEVLQSYKPFVKKTVSSVCKKYITESDDEFSIGLMAFHDSILKFNQDKGNSLLSFAEVIIKRKVIDYIRKNGKYNDISLAVSPFEKEEDQSNGTLEETLSFEEYKKKKEQELRKEEIIRYQQTLLEFDLSLDELMNESPKHEDARINAIGVAEIVAGTDEYKNYLFEKKRLPIKKIEEHVNVSRKTIERNRKYIISVVLILSGDFIFLKDYLKGRLGL